MLKALLIAWLVLAAAIGIAAAIIPSVEIDGGFFALLGVALLFGLVNALIGPFLRFVSAPLTLVTLGLFSLVVNGLLLALTAGLSSNLNVGGFFSCVLAAILISIVSTILGFLVGAFVRDEEPAS